jgi:hypothetical protein
LAIPWQRAQRLELEVDACGPVGVEHDQRRVAPAGLEEAILWPIGG